MARPLLLIAAAGTALLVALFLLWQSTLSGSPAVPATPADEPHAAADPASPPSGPPPAAASGPAARGKLATGGASAPTRGTSSAAPALGASPATSEYVDPMSNTENLHFGGAQLKEQAAAVEPLVRECVAKAASSGQRQSGEAVLTYVVAKRGDKYLVEDTSYDDDETTLAQGALLDCLHGTAKAMKFVGLPRRSQALVVMRKVKVENGELAEYKHVGFSYLR